MVEGRERLEVIAPCLFTIVNESLSSNLFPDYFKQACVQNLLKKPGLDPALPHNYRPISKLPLSKKIEKAVTKKLLETVETNNILDPFQSGCRMLMNADSGHHSILVFLDLSVTF